MLHYNPRHVSSINKPIFRRTNFIITASVIVTLCKRLYSMPDESRLNVVCFLVGNSPASEFRSRGITQKKAYNIQNTAKVWNQEQSAIVHQTAVFTYMIILYSKCFDHPSVHPQDVDVTMYQTHPAIDQTAYMNACRNTIKLLLQVFLRMDVRNMSKTL
jgi:hypothetical protein